MVAGNITRRRFLKESAIGLGALAAASQGLGAPKKADKPNILWITCEDISPNLGCYGDTYARTPVLDKMASEGVLFTNAYAICGVCAPNRSCLVTGVWPSTLGSHDMRSNSWLPQGMQCMPWYLQKAGYDCKLLNLRSEWGGAQKKKDYNFIEPADTWSEGESWKNSRDPKKPFYGVINIFCTHESQCRKSPRNRELFDPAKVPIPPFHPDTPEVRGNWAEYHENISEMDKRVGIILGQLEDDGLAEDTIVFFFGDHGAGMPGCKKWVWESGLRVPFIMRFPEKYAHLAPARLGEKTDRMVSFVDFPPTVLSLCGAEIPSHMQGEPVLGSQATKPRKYVFAIRDRMGECHDTVRVVRDKQFQYNRNFMPHVTWSQFMSYTEEMPTMSIWRQLHNQGKLNTVQDRYFQPTKPLEELYDVARDPHQVNNLAGDPAYKTAVERMRKELRLWMERTHDLGLLPEYEMHKRAEGSSPYELAHDSSKHPQKKLMEIADMANAMDPSNIRALAKTMREDADPAVRWWAAVGLAALGDKAEPALESVQQAAKDESPIVRIAAAEVLCNLGKYDEGLPILEKGLQDRSPFIRLRTMRVLANIGEHARPLLPQIKNAKFKGKVHAGGYANRMVGYLPQWLEGDTK
ncbi:MAG: sulfatase-like hydrolase/transferase [Planctomycetota bacterium]|jgi:arylsulfatase A-like enzyme